MCYAVPQPVYFTWQCVIRYHDQCNLVICHTVPQPVYFTWQCVMRYHDQCNRAIAGCGTVWHIASWNTLVVVPYDTLPGEIHWLWYRITHCQLKYTVYGGVFHLAMWHMVSQSVQPSNMSYDTTTSVFHLTMCYPVPQPVYFTWQCVMRYHDQCSLAICHTVPQPHCQVKGTGCGTA
jgi:hypothetical protein